MFRTLLIVSILASLFTITSPEAAANKNLGLRADMCANKQHDDCRGFHIQNNSSAIVTRTIIRHRTTIVRDGYELCKNGRDKTVKTNLSEGDRFQLRLDTRCDYYVRFHTSTCSGDRDITVRSEELDDAPDDFSEPTIALKGGCASLDTLVRQVKK